MNEKYEKILEATKSSIPTELAAEQKVKIQKNKLDPSGRPE